MPLKILFVCSGNICRSPAAEAICRLELAKTKLTAELGGCGTLKISGEHAAPYTVRSLADRGVDLGSFRSRAMSYFLLREADHIVCMEDHHRRAVLHELGGDRDLVKSIAVITEFHPQERYRNDAGIYDFVQAEWEEYAEGIAEVEACVQYFVQTLVDSADTAIGRTHR